MMATPSTRKTANAFVENEDDVEPWRRSAGMDSFNVLEACSECCSKGVYWANWARCMKQRRPHQVPSLRRVKSNKLEKAVACVVQADGGAFIKWDGNTKCLIPCDQCRFLSQCREHNHVLGTHPIPFIHESIAGVTPARRSCKRVAEDTGDQARGLPPRSMPKIAKRAASSPRMTPSRNVTLPSPPTRSSTPAARSRASTDSPPACSALFCEPPAATPAAGTDRASPTADPLLQASGEVSSSSQPKRAQGNGKGPAASPRTSSGRVAARRISNTSLPEYVGGRARAGPNEDDTVDETSENNQNDVAARSPENIHGNMTARESELKRDLAEVTEKMKNMKEDMAGYQRVIDETTKQVNEARRRITTYEQTKSKAAKLVDNSQQDMTKLEKMSASLKSDLTKELNRRMEELKEQVKALNAE